MKYLSNVIVAIFTAAFFLMSAGAQNLSAQIDASKNKSAVIQAAPKKRPPKLTVQELTQQSEIVAIGKITDLRSDWSSDRSHIYTRAILTVEEYVKGGLLQRTLTITYQGGEVGTEGELYSHAVRFQKNEEVVVFTKKDPQGNLQVTGGEQGKFIIGKDIKTAQKMVSAYTSLDELKTQVKNYTKSQGVK